MSLKEIFRSELDFLRKDGKYFSTIHPHLSQFLSEEMIDPEAERIIESFAFLTARLKEKIKDDFPELTRSMIELLWPNYLRPLPSTSILRFEPRAYETTTQHIVSKGTLVDSKPVDGTYCHFQTTQEVSIYPIQLDSCGVSTSYKASTLELNFVNISQNDYIQVGCNELSIYLSGSDYCALTCYQWLFNYLNKLVIEIDGKRTLLPIELLQNQGFSDAESLIEYPKNAFDGYRLIQEFFFFPKKFYFFKLKNLQPFLKDSSEKTFKLIFEFNRPLPHDLNLNLSDFSLYCSPVVNLFQHSAIPIRLDGTRERYPIIPAGQEKNHYEIFQVDEVTGIKLDNHIGNSNQLSTYMKFESFEHDLNNTSEGTPFYKVDIKDNIEESGYDHFISFVSMDGEVNKKESETISIDLRCTNRDLPESLNLGDISIQSQDTPSYVKFENIIKPVASVRPQLTGKLHWQLISNLSLNYMSLCDIEMLKTVLSAYDFSSVHDIQAHRRTQKRLNAIKEITTRPIDRVIKGVMFRGVKSIISIDTNGFLCEGEVYLFGTILSEFFRLYGTINSFHELEIININNKEVFKWNSKKALHQLI